MARSKSDSALRSLLTALPEAPLPPNATAPCPPLFKASGGQQAGRRGRRVQQLGVDVEMAEAAAGSAAGSTAAQQRKVGRAGRGGWQRVSRGLRTAVHGARYVGRMGRRRLAMTQSELHAAQSAGAHWLDGPLTPLLHTNRASQGGSARAQYNKENRCGNAATAAAAPVSGLLSPRLARGGEPLAAHLPGSASSPAELLAPEPLGEAGRQGAGRPTSRTGDMAAAPALRVAAAAPNVAVPLSTWKLQQLAAASQAQHGRERQLLAALEAGEAFQPVAEGDAGAGASAVLGSPPGITPAQQARRGGGPPGGSGGRRDAPRQPASATAPGTGRPARAAAALGGRRGQAAELVLGPALARACALLRRQRLSEFPGPLLAAAAAH